MTDNPDDEGYPIDPDAEGRHDDLEDEDGPGKHVPYPRHQHVRGQLQAHKPRSKKAQKRLTKSSNRILAQENRKKSLELRKAGATYQQIAEAVGYHDASGARKAVMKAFGEVIQEPVAELRTMQVERLNHMLMVLWPKVQGGDERAISTALMVMNKIDALMGTEAAKQVEVTDTKSILVIDGDKDGYIAALKKMSGAGVSPDGTNMKTTVTAEQIKALPSPEANRYPPGMGGPVQQPSTEDVVEGVLVDDNNISGDTPTSSAEGPKMSDCTSPLGTVCKDPACPLHYGRRTKKQFKFGVDPTVRRKEG
jgi:hypothetical protein